MIPFLLAIALQDPPIGWNDPAVPRAKVDQHKGCDGDTITPKGKGRGTFDGTVRRIGEETLAHLGPRTSLDAAFYLHFDGKTAARIDSISVRVDAPLEARLRPWLKEPKGETLTAAMIERIYEGKADAFVLTPALPFVAIGEIFVGLFTEMFGSDLEPDVPANQKRKGFVHLVAPPQTKPGVYKGTLTVKGNFTPVTLDFRVTVTDYDAQVARILSRPDRATPLETVFEKIKPRKGFAFTFGDPGRNPPISDVAGSRVLVADEIWDLAHLQTVGPVLQTKEGVLKTLLRGERLYVLRSKSIDVVDLRTRKTVQQIARGGAETMRISPDAQRVLITRGKTVALWKDGAWTELGEFDSHVVDERLRTLVGFRESLRIHSLTDGGSQTVASGAKSAHRMAMSEPKQSVLIQPSANSPDLLLLDWSRASVQGVKPTLAAIKNVAVNSQGDFVWTDGTSVEAYRFKTGKVEKGGPFPTSPPTSLFSGITWQYAGSGTIRFEKP